MGFISNIVDTVTGGKDAAKAAEKGSGVAADAMIEGGEQARDAYRDNYQYQREGEIKARDYLRNANEIDRQGSSNAQRRLMGLYGIGGGTGSQQTLIDQAENSPLYGAITGTRKAGEESIARNASMTGGLRSGNVQANMYDFNQRLDERALLESYNQQLGGLEDISRWQTNENNIAEAMMRPGETRTDAFTQGDLARASSTAEAGGLRGLGITGAGQAIQSGRAGLADLAGNVAGAVWSDRRLKDNIEFIGNHHGINVYEWQWNVLAEALGLSGYDTGVRADEVELVMPEAVGEREGFKTVNYAMLGA